MIAVRLNFIAIGAANQKVARTSPGMMQRKSPAVTLIPIMSPSPMSFGRLRVQWPSSAPGAWLNARERPGDNQGGAGVDDDCSSELNSDHQQEPR